MDFKEVKQSLLSISGVKEIHNLRIWSLTMDKIALSVHLALGKYLIIDKIALSVNLASV